jgi:ABC-type lipoprotein release transport system permease subunit
MTQVTSGVIAGSLLIAVGAFAIQYTTAFQATEPRGLTVTEVALLVAYALLMLGICALACVVPTIRALRVQPMEALRTE